MIVRYINVHLLLLLFTITAGALKQRDRIFIRQPCEQPRMYQLRRVPAAIRWDRTAQKQGGTGANDDLTDCQLADWHLKSSRQPDHHGNIASQQVFFVLGRSTIQFVTNIVRLLVVCNYYHTNLSKTPTLTQMLTLTLI